MRSASYDDTVHSLVGRHLLVKCNKDRSRASETVKDPVRSAEEFFNAISVRSKQPKTTRGTMNSPITRQSSLTYVDPTILNNSQRCLHAWVSAICIETTDNKCGGKESGL